MNNATLNAIATTYDRVFLVGLFYGALHNIESFFAFALAHPRVLRHIGQSGRETAWLKSLSGCDWRGSFSEILRQIQTNDKPPASFPVDPMRKLAAHRLAILAMDFLFFHEIGHLANGHMEFLAETGQTVHVAEASRAGLSREKALDSQSLELNADSHAISTMFGDCFSIPERFLPSNAFGSLSEFIESIVLAITLLFIFFDPLRTAVSAYDREEHPHPAVRLTNAFVAASQMAERVSDTWSRRFSTAWKRGLEQAEEMYVALGVDSSIWRAATTDSRKMMQSYDTIVAHFQLVDRQLRPDLRRW